MWEEHFLPAASGQPSSQPSQQAAVEGGSEGQPALLPQGLDAGSAAEPERRCVLEVEVVNRTDLVLQVCTCVNRKTVSAGGQHDSCQSQRGPLKRFPWKVCYDHT